MNGKQSGSCKTRSDSLGNPVVSRNCAYCGQETRTGRTYCDVGCYRAKQRSQPIEARFWSKVEKTEGCWLWTSNRAGGRNGGRYGQFGITVNGVQKMRGAHVVSYELAYGPVPDGLEVMHECHNSLCVRPDHLKAGTRRENVRASADAGHYHVARPKRQKLTPGHVAELRSLAASGAPGVWLAERFGISETYVSFLVRGLRRQYDVPQEAS